MPESAQLAAIIYADGESHVADEVLADVVERLASRNVRMAGTIQANTDRDGMHCNMTLENLATGEKLDIAENRGMGARGCRMNVPLFEALVGQVQASLRTKKPDLLVINRFGKREVEGRGFRDVIAEAAGRGIPVVVALNESTRAAWTEFTAGEGAVLPVSGAALWKWCLEHLAPETAGEAAE